MNESGGSKTKKIIIIIISVVIILGLIINVTLLLTALLRDNDTKTDNEFEIGVNNNTVSSDTRQPAVQNAETPQVQSGQNYTTVSDVEEKVKTIRSWYNETQNNPSSTASKGLTKSNSNISYNGKSYSAEYYYNNGSLYFVFAYNGTNENRLYFWNGTMFRWIDENGTIHDNEFDNPSFNEWAHIV